MSEASFFPLFYPSGASQLIQSELSPNVSSNSCTLDLKQLALHKNFISNETFSWDFFFFSEKKISFHLNENALFCDFLISAFNTKLLNWNQSLDMIFFQLLLTHHTDKFISYFNVSTEKLNLGLQIFASRLQIFYYYYFLNNPLSSAIFDSGGYVMVISPCLDFSLETHRLIYILACISS